LGKQKAGRYEGSYAEDAVVMKMIQVFVISGFGLIFIFKMWSGTTSKKKGQK
jgi:hypothetical protein